MVRRQSDFNQSFTVKSKLRSFEKKIKQPQKYLFFWTVWSQRGGDFKKGNSYKQSKVCLSSSLLSL